MVLYFILLGVLCDNVKCVIGNGVVLLLEVLMKEIGMLEECGVLVCECLLISEVCLLILFFYIVLDLVCEKVCGDKLIGMIGCGIGLVYEDKVVCCGLCVGDLFNLE